MLVFSEKSMFHDLAKALVINTLTDIKDKSNSMSIRIIQWLKLKVEFTQYTYKYKTGKFYNLWVIS